MDDIPFYCKLCPFLSLDFPSLQKHRLTYEFNAKGVEDENSIIPDKKKRLIVIWMDMKNHWYLNVQYATECCDHLTL